MRFLHKEIASNRLYNDLSKYYEFVITKENYRGEVPFWLNLIDEKRLSERTRLLELASGPGHLLSYLTPHVDATVIDLSPAMLERCRILNPNVETVHGDITKFSLPTRYDFILLHDSIGHLFSSEDIRATFERAYAHLTEGGVFALSPEFDDEQFNESIVYNRTTAREEGDLTVIDYIERHPSDRHRLNVLTSYYDHDDGNTVIEFDRMELGLFGVAYFQQIMESVGFDVERYTKPENSSTECLTVLVGTKVRVV